MAKPRRVVFLPVTRKRKKGQIVVRNKQGRVVIRIPVSRGFDPKTIFFEAHCCDGALGNCRVRKAGENCADTDKPITVWY